MTDHDHSEDPRLALVAQRVAVDPTFAAQVAMVNIADNIADILTNQGGIARLAELQQTTPEDIERRLGVTIGLLSHAVALFLIEEATSNYTPEPGEVEDFLKGLFGGSGK